MEYYPLGMRAITEKDIKELDTKIKSKEDQKIKIKQYKKKRFQLNHPILYKLFHWSKNEIF